MSVDVGLAKQVVQEKLESRLKDAEAKLHALKLKAEVAKTAIEIKAIVDLLGKAPAIHHKLEEFNKAAGDRREQAKTDLEKRVADFENSVKAIESKAKAS